MNPSSRCVARASTVSLFLLRIWKTGSRFSDPQLPHLKRPAAFRFSLLQQLEPLKTLTHRRVAPPTYYYRVVPVAEPEPRNSPLSTDSSSVPRQAEDFQKPARDFKIPSPPGETPTRPWSQRTFPPSGRKVRPGPSALQRREPLRQPPEGNPPSFGNNRPLVLTRTLLTLYHRVARTAWRRTWATRTAHVVRRSHNRDPLSHREL